MTTGRVLALQAVPATAPIDTGVDVARGIVALLAVTALLVGFLWLLRRGTFAAGGRRGRQGLAVESAISLGERRSLVIVGVEGRRLLLGVSPGQVSLITELGPAPFGQALDGALLPGADAAAHRAGEGRRS